MSEPVNHAIAYRFADWRQEKELMMRVRTPVFVKEQRVPHDIEIDEFDPLYLHVIATDADGNPVGTARMSDDGHIGRCAVLKQYRGRGIGAFLVTMLIDKAVDSGLRSVCLNSQVSAVPFYEKLGFVSNGPEYIEANIVHAPMVKKISPLPSCAAGGRV